MTRPTSLLALGALAGAAVLSAPAQALDYEQINSVINDFSLTLPGPVQVSAPGEKPVIVVNSDIVCTGPRIEALTIGSTFPDINTLVTALHVEDLSLKCRIDKATISEVTFIGTIITALDIDIQKTDVDTSIIMASPDFNTSAPEALMLGECGVNVEELSIDFESNLGFILNLVKGQTEEKVKVTLKDEICGLLPGLFNGLSGPVSFLGEAINNALSDLETPIDFLASENAVVDDGRNLFSLKENPTINGTVTAIGDALRATDENGDLKANGIIQTLLNLLANFVGGEPAEAVDGELVLDFTEEPFQLLNLGLTTTNVTLAVPRVKITGLTNFDKLDLNLIGDFTGLFEFSAPGDLAIEIDGLFKSFKTDDLTAVIEDTFTISTSVSDIVGALGSSTILDKDIYDTTQIGSLGQTFLRCVLNMFYSDPEIIPSLGVSAFVAPAIVGLDSDGTADIINSVLNFVLSAYEKTLIPALPKVLPAIADAVLNSTFAPLRPYECADYIEDPEDPFFDASNQALYNQLQSFVEGTLVEFLDPENINNITEAQSGVAGKLVLTDGVVLPEFVLPELASLGELAGKTVSLDLKNLALSGLNTVSQDIKVLSLVEGDDFPYSFLSQAALGSLGFSGDIKYTVEGELTDFTLDASVADFATVAQFIAKAKNNDILSKELGQIQSMDCLISLASSGPVGVQNFELEFTPAGSITCRACNEALTNAANDPATVIADINTWKTDKVTEINTEYNVEAVAAKVTEATAKCEALSSRRGNGSGVMLPAIIGGLGGVMAVATAGVILRRRSSTAAAETSEVDVFAAHRVSQESENNMEDFNEKV